MPTMLSPGVFIEQITEPPGIAGVGTSTGAFIGLAEKGDADKAVLISDYEQFVAVFGRALPNSYLAYAVSSFFAEGGENCYVVRVTGTAESSANIELNGADANPSLRITARAPGVWGNSLEISIGDSTDGVAEHFKVTVRYQETFAEDFPVPPDSTFATEVYDNLTTENIEAKISGVSTFVDAAYLPLADAGLEAARTAADKRPANNAPNTFSPLAGGSAGASSPDFIGQESTKTGLHALDGIDDVNIVVIPDLAGDRSKTLQALTYCENRGDCFMIIDPPRGLSTQEVVEYKKGTGSFSGNILSSSYGAVYFPWVIVEDVLSGVARTVPASGIAAGIYARTDLSRGVFKAPAGRVDGLTQTVVGLDGVVTEADQNILNPEGVNALRTFPGTPPVVWGARTLSPSSEFRFVNVRRLMLFLSESFDRGTQFAVFEINGPALRARVRRNLSSFLEELWRAGALFGDNPDEAFFVKVDDENNPAATRDAGQLIVDVGIAATRPAEFIVVRVTQQTREAETS